MARDSKSETTTDESMVGQPVSMGNSSQELRKVLKLLARQVGLGCVEIPCTEVADSFHLTPEGEPVGYCRYHGKTRYGKVPSTWKRLTMDEYRVARIMQS